MSIPHAKALRGPCGAENWKLGVLDLNQILYIPEVFHFDENGTFQTYNGGGLKSTAKASCKYSVDQGIVEVLCKRCCKFNRVLEERSLVLSSYKKQDFQVFLFGVLLYLHFVFSLQT